MWQNEIASAALQAGKTAAKDIGMKAVDVSKAVAIDGGNKLVEKASKNYPHPNRKWLIYSTFNFFRHFGSNTIISIKEIKIIVYEIISYSIAK